MSDTPTAPFMVLPESTVSAISASSVPAQITSFMYEYVGERRVVREDFALALEAYGEKVREACAAKARSRDPEPADGDDQFDRGYRAGIAAAVMAISHFNVTCAPGG